MTKKYTYMLLLAATILTLSASAQTRLALFEDHTGEGCGPCLPANHRLDSLMFAGTNPSKAVLIRYAVQITHHFYNGLHAVDSERGAYYPTPYIPAGWFDGKYLYPTSITQADIDTAHAKLSPFQMSVKSALNTTKDSITVTVKVKAVAPYIHPGSSVKLRVARCKSIDLGTNHLGNGEQHLKNLVRDMFPDASGLNIANVWFPGNYQSYIFKARLNVEDYSAWYPGLTYTDSMVVAWIQNDSDKIVAQCAKEGLNLSNPMANVAAIEGGQVQLTVHPNPANNTLYIDACTGEGQHTNVTISNIEGRIFYNQNKELLKGKNALAIDVRDLPTGTYSLIMKTGDNVMSRIFSIVR